MYSTPGLLYLYQSPKMWHPSIHPSACLSSRYISYCADTNARVLQFRVSEGIRTPSEYYVCECE